MGKKKKKSLTQKEKLIQKIARLILSPPKARKSFRFPEQPKPETSDDPRERRKAVREGGASAAARLVPSRRMSLKHARGKKKKKR